MMLYSYEHAFIFLLKLHFTALKQNSFFLLTVFCYLLVASLAHAVHQGMHSYSQSHELGIKFERKQELGFDS